VSIVGPKSHNSNVLLTEVAETSRAVATTSARLAKRELLADCLRRAAPEEVAIAVAYLSGDLPQRQIGVGWAALRDRPSPAAEPTLTVAEIDAAFTAIGQVSGKGSVATRKALLDALFARATADEHGFLLRLLSGELRQGALDGVMADAIAAAAKVPAAEVRRAVMFRGSLGAVAAAALSEGSEGLRGFGLEVGRPVKPMLAASAPSIEAAMEKVSPAAVEWKLDGIRVQAHVRDGGVRLFTRTLDDITARLPEAVTALGALPVHTAVFDGELIALRGDGRPHPFQVTSARVARHGAGQDVPLSVFLFDVLHLGARDPETGGFVMLGKTFKGLTDEMLDWQTERLLALEDHRDAYTIESVRATAVF
jgi:DNA ligase-1